MNPSRALIILLIVAISGPVVHAAEKPQPDVPVWLETSLKRVFPNTTAGSPELALLGARNGRLSFQPCIRNTQLNVLQVKCEIVGADDLKPQVRWVGLVPMPHLTTETDPSELDGPGALPGLVPDPLYQLKDMACVKKLKRSNCHPEPLKWPRHTLEKGKALSS